MITYHLTHRRTWYIKNIKKLLYFCCGYKLLYLFEITFQKNHKYFRNLTEKIWSKVSNLTVLKANRAYERGRKSSNISLIQYDNIFRVLLVLHLRALECRPRGTRSFEIFCCFFFFHSQYVSTFKKTFFAYFFHENSFLKAFNIRCPPGQMKSFNLPIKSLHWKNIFAACKKELSKWKYCKNRNNNKTFLSKIKGLHALQ